MIPMNFYQKPISYTHRFRGQLVNQTEPWIMAILNATPDSFFEGSRLADDAVERAGECLQLGAHLLDIGGQSTRPGATRISAAEELDRVMPALEAIVKAFPNARISIDTFYSLVANEALKAGAAVVNDVSAGSLDAELWNVVAKHQAIYLLMHMQGDPQSMQNKPQYAHVTHDITKTISLQLNALHNKGISDVWIDPGFGFGKTLEHNFQLLRELEAFQLFNCPVLVGMSRKKMIQTATGRSSEEVIYGTTAAHFAALERGAAILRVHDVEPARQAIAIYQNLRANS